MTQAITPLRQRMIDDMRLRKLAPKTQSAYLLHVQRLAAVLHRSPDTATGEDLRRFQLHMVEQGFTSTTLNVTISGDEYRQISHDFSAPSKSHRERVPPLDVRSPSH